MTAELRVSTPEHVGVVYPLAGIGSRFLAAFLDGVLLLLLFAGLSLLAASVGQLLPVSGTTGAVLAGVFVVLLFLVVPFAYYVLFETFWNGQTLGKRLVGIRVLRDDGSPIDFVAAAARNLIRTIDLLPPALAADVLVMLLSRKGQRLGDLVAGTVVVKARMERDFARYRTRAGEAAPLVTTRALSGEAQRLVREFALREASLGEDARREVARSIAATIRPVVPESAEHPDDIAFVRAVAASLRASGNEASARD